MGGAAAPSKLLEEDELLDFTAAFDEETWESTRGALQYFEAGETTHSRYGYVPTCAISYSVAPGDICT